MTERQVRVSMIEPVGGHGGMNYYDIGLCRGLGRAGARVTLHTCDRNPPAAEPGVFDVQTSFAGVYGRDAAWRRGLRFVRGLLKALVGDRLHGASVAHFHFFHVGVLEYLGVLLARALGYWVVVTAHDVEAFKAGLSVKSLVHRSYALVHAVVAHNESSAREVVAKLAVDPKRVHIVAHGSYVDFLRPAKSVEEARAAVGLPTDSSVPVVLFFGQIKEVKGLDVLIEAFAMLRGQLADARLVIAGRVWKDDFSKYEAMLTRLQLAAATRLHVRYIPDEEVPNFYAAAQVVVLPYRRIYQSGVLLMAMSFGTPVIASDLDAMKEVVVDGENGFLFKQGNAADLARVMQLALTDAGLSVQVRNAAAAHMRNRFGWDGIGHAMLDVYRLKEPAA